MISFFISKMTNEDSRHIFQPEDSKPVATVTAKPVDSGETFFSLFKPVKNITENVKVRAMALVKLASSLGWLSVSPFIPVVDAMNSRFSQKELALEKIKISDHESAHLLLSILNNEPMVDAWLTPFGDYTTLALGLPDGTVSPEHRGHVAFSRSGIGRILSEIETPKSLDASKLSDESIVKYGFMLLAGEAVNVDIEGEEKGRMEISMDRRFTSSVGEGTDIARVKRILKTTKYKDVAKPAFDLLKKKIIEFLKDPGVRKIVDIFSVKLLESGHIHKKGESIVPMMMELLEKNGVSKAEFEGFQGKYDEMVKATAVEMKGLLG